MKSKIRVEYDLEAKEPYIQFYLEKVESGSEQDLRDVFLKNFLETVHPLRLGVRYPAHADNAGTPQIRIIPEEAMLIEMEGYCNGLVANYEYVDPNHGPARTKTYHQENIAEFFRTMREIFAYNNK